MSGELHLFDLPEHTDTKKLSPDRRRTLRQREQLAAGIHPATHRQLLAPEWGYTCGDCSHAVGTGHNLRTYWKCELAGITRGAGTDIRISWRACNLFTLDGEAADG